MSFLLKKDFSFFWHSILVLLLFIIFGSEMRWDKEGRMWMRMQCFLLIVCFIIHNCNIPCIGGIHTCGSQLKYIHIHHTFLFIICTHAHTYIYVCIIYILYIVVYTCILIPSRHSGEGVGARNERKSTHLSQNFAAKE